MDYRRLSKTDLDLLCDFWNINKDVIFKAMDHLEIESKFLTCTTDYEVVSFVAIDHNDIIGFSSGTYVKNSDVAYITCILVKTSYRRKNIGSHLLELLEKEIKKNHQINRLELSFFNPVHLEWLIPGTISSDHPNAPGADMKSSYYSFMKKHLYLDYAIQNAYYLDLREYHYSDKIEEKRKILHEMHIDITLYDPKKHSGFDDLFSDLKSDHWKKEITQNLNDENLRDDVLIVEKNHLIYGFAGPLRIQKSGRGYFAGIGVHSALRGLGAGSVLFASLCMELKKMGAHYMSIFTGDKNKARHIYEAEGFKIVKTWANMRKEIKKGAYEL